MPAPLPHLRPLTVVIADDSELARASLRCILGELPHVTLLGEAASGPGLLELCRQTRPQLALVDIRMPGLNGIEVTRALKRTSPAPHVIILTLMAQPALLVEALRAGARGYLLKDLSLDELVRALAIVQAGGLYLDPELASATLQELVARP